MKQIDVRDQVSLGFRRTAELCLSGIRYRLFRSMVTVATIAMAVAFLMTMLGQSLVGRNVRVALDRMTAPRHQYVAWLSRLSTPMTDADVAEIVRQEPADPSRLAEVLRWGAIGEDELATLREIAQTEARYMAYFNRLDEGHRSLLLRADVDRGAMVFETFQNSPQALDDFYEGLQHAPVPMDDDLRAGMEEFVVAWNAARPLRTRVRRGHGQAIEALNARLGDRRLLEVLQEADESTIALIREFGFRMEVEEVENLRHHARLELTGERMRRLSSLPSVRTFLAGQASIPVNQVSEMTLYRQCRTEGGAEDLLRHVRDPNMAAMDPQDMADVAQARMAQAELAQVEARLRGDDTDGFLGFSRRVMWLIMVSFGVCAVGIANAMLMSVTERFREIATMKCLGAMDRFIMVLFVMESCLQGLAGGIVGALLGLLLGVLRSWVEYGWMAFSEMPTSSLLSAAGISLVAGMFLAAMAAVYPAWVASRLAPMEAMRVE